MENRPTVNLISHIHSPPPPHLMQPFHLRIIVFSKSLNLLGQIVVSSFKMFLPGNLSVVILI